MSFASPAASIVEWICKRLVHAFPYSFPGRGGLVEEFSKIKKAPLIAELRGGQRMKVPAIPEGIGYYLAGCLTDEEPTTNCLTRELDRGDCFLDVGANFGFYSLLAAGAVGSTGQVHAFEPQPELVSYFLDSVALNGCSSYVFVNHLAVTDRAGQEVRLYLARDGCSTGIASIFQHAWLDASGILVPTVSIDSYVAAHALSGPFVIKMDIEGAEVLALRGMAALLASGHIKLLIIEMSAADNASPAGIVSALADYGYEARTIERNGCLGDAFTEHDARALQHTVNVAFKSRPSGAASG